MINLLKMLKSPLPEDSHPQLLYAVKLVDTKNRQRQIKCWLADATASNSANDTRMYGLFWHVRGLGIDGLEMKEGTHGLPSNVKSHGIDEPNPNQCTEGPHGITCRGFKGIY